MQLNYAHADNHTPTTILLGDDGKEKVDKNVDKSPKTSDASKNCKQDDRIRSCDDSRFNSSRIPEIRDRSVIDASKNNKQDGQRSCSGQIGGGFDGSKTAFRNHGIIQKQQQNLGGCVKIVSNGVVSDNIVNNSPKIVENHESIHRQLAYVQESRPTKKSLDLSPPERNTILSYVCTPENSPENQPDKVFFTEKPNKALFNHTVQSMVNTTSVIVNNSQCTYQQEEDMSKKRKLDHPISQSTNYKLSLSNTNFYKKSLVRPIRIIYQEPKKVQDPPVQPRLVIIKNNQDHHKDDRVENVQAPKIIFIQKDQEQQNIDSIPPPKIIFVQNTTEDLSSADKSSFDDAGYQMSTKSGKSRKITVDTPPTSEHSSDNDLSSKEGSYTYDDLIVRDGR